MLAALIFWESLTVSDTILCPHQQEYIVLIYTRPSVWKQWQQFVVKMLHTFGEKEMFVLGLARMVAKLCSLLMFVSKHGQICTPCPKEKTESSGQTALKQRLTFDWRYATCSVLDEENAWDPMPPLWGGLHLGTPCNSFHTEAQQVRFFCEKFGLYLSHPPLHARCLGRLEWIQTWPSWKFQRFLLGKLFKSREEQAMQDIPGIEL